MNVDDSIGDLRQHDGCADESVGGFSLDALIEYALSDRTPVREDIESDVEAHRAVTQLQRLQRLMQEVLVQEGADAPESPWFHRVMHELRDEMGHGRTVPLGEPNAATSFTISEGALKSLIRAAGDAVGSAVIGRVTFTGDLSVAGVPIGIAIEAAVRARASIPDAAQQIRAAVERALHEHTTLTVGSVDVTIIDVVPQHDWRENHD